MNEYKYDVAFSFLKEDEALAISLHSALSETIRSFIYTEQQKRLAGSDGEVIFNKVFGQEARVVVVLYRKEWGTTPWTRIEETAIRNRAHEEGYDFTLFIPLDGDPSVPKWLPKTRIWLSFHNRGVDGAIAVIEAKVTESGGEIALLTNADRVRLANEEIKRESQRNHLLRTKGDELYNAELLTLIDEYRKEVADILKDTPDWHLKLDNTRTGISIVSYGHQLLVRKNDGIYSYVKIGLWDGVWPPEGYTTHGNNPRQILLNDWKFDISEHNQHGWSIHDKGTNFITTSQMVKNTMEKLMELASAYKLKNIKSYE